MKKITTILVGALLSLGAAQANAVTVNDSSGSVTFAQTPQRIAAYHTVALEILLALDEQPVGFGGIVKDQRVGAPIRSLPGFRGQLSSEPVFIGSPPNAEVLASLKPDMLLTHVLKNADAERKIRNTVPTLMFNFGASDGWRRAIVPVGQVLGKTAEAQNVMQRIDRQYAVGKSKLEPVWSRGKRLVVLNIYKNRLFKVDPNFAAAQTFGKLGFEVLGSGERMQPISTEGLLALRADRAVILATDPDTAVLSEAIMALRRTGLKSLNVVYPTRHAPNGAGPISEPLLIDYYVKVLGKNAR